LVDDFDTPCVRELLEKDKDKLLHAFWDLYIVGSLTVPEELHKISLLRSLSEFAGAKTDIRQHRLDLRYTSNYNANIFRSMFGISGSKPFGTFNSQKMLDALSKSPIFYTIREADFIQWSAKLMNQLPIGFPDGYLVCYSPWQTRTLLIFL
jgi:hypothetical protein